MSAAYLCHKVAVLYQSALSEYVRCDWSEVWFLFIFLFATFDRTHIREDMQVVRVEDTKNRLKWKEVICCGNP